MFNQNLLVYVAEWMELGGDCSRSICRKRVGIARKKRGKGSIDTLGVVKTLIACLT